MANSDILVPNADLGQTEMSEFGAVKDLLQGLLQGGQGIPGGARDKELACQCRRCKETWV